MTPSPAGTPRADADAAAVGAAASAAGGGRLRAGASVLGTIVSLVAVAAIVWWALRQEPPQLPQTPGQLLALGGAVAFYAIATLVRGERWHSLLRADGAVPSRADTHALNVVGYAANNLLPARAGDAVRTVLMAPRAQTSRRTVLGTLVAERLLDVAVILVLFVVVGYGVLGAVTGDSLGLTLAIVAAVALAAAGSLWLLRRQARVRAFVAPMLSSTLGLRSRRGALLLGATVVIWTLETLVWMLAGAAVGFAMTPLEGAYVVALASVFALIPSGPGYAGTQDAAAVVAIKALGGSGGVAVAYLLTIRFILLVPITLVGLVLGALRYGGLRRIRLARTEGA